MKKYTYHKEAYEFYHCRRSSAVALMYLALACIAIIPFIGLSFPTMDNLMEGRVSVDESIGLISSISVLVFFFSRLFEFAAEGRLMQSVEMYELEICDKHILVTYPSAQNGNTTPEKKFLQIPYDEIAKVDFQREYIPGQKTNFTVYHKSGCVELCIENPEEAAQTIEKRIKRVKAKESVAEFSDGEVHRKESPKDKIKRKCACCGEVYFTDSAEESEYCPLCLKELNL